MARVTLSSNRKFRHLVTALGSRPLARGVLELLWEPAFEVGDPYVGTSDDVEAVCGWTGQRGALTKALVECGAPKGAGFIEPYDGGVRDATEPHYQIHDFFHHCPDYVVRRRAREQEKTAVAKTCTVCGEAYVSSVSYSLFCSKRCRQAASRARLAKTSDTKRQSATVSRQSRDTTRARARARVQTDVHTSTSRTVTAEAASRSAADPAPATPEVSSPVVPSVVPGSPIVLTFPVVGTGGHEWHLREMQIEHWRGLYPQLDIPGEARQALAWVEADKTRRKTQSGMERFLVSWFNRSVDRGPRGPTVVTGSLKTAGNAAALQAFLARREAK